MVVARISAAYGIKGWIKLVPANTLGPSVLLDCPAWWINEAGAKPRPAKLLAVRQQGATIVAQLSDLSNREAAAALRGATVSIRRAQFPAPAEGEYYWIDLIGSAVSNRAGQGLGQVVDVLENSAHALLQVRRDASETDSADLLIPFVERHLVDVDVANRKIVVDWELDY